MSRPSFRLASSETTTPVIAVCAGCLFACRSVFALISVRSLNIGSEPGVATGFASSILLALSALFAAWGANTITMRQMLQSRPLRWVLFYLVFAGASLIWGVSASPGASALYWSGLVLDVSAVMLLSITYKAKYTAHALMKGFIAGTCVLATIAWTMPPEADLRLGDLEYFNTNQIGNLCALALLMCMLLASRTQGRWRFTSAFLGVTLIRSLSKSTLIAFLACLLYRLLRDRSIGTYRKWVLAGTSVAVIACFWGLFEAYYSVYTTAGNQAETLTGRTAIWSWALNAAWAHPWFGNGFDAMWKIAPPFGGELFEARHAENELLQQFFAYGVCGVALLAGVYGSLYRSFRRFSRGSEQTCLICFLLYVVIRGFAEAEPFDLLLPLWLISALALLVQYPAQPELLPAHGKNAELALSLRRSPEGSV